MNKNKPAKIAAEPIVSEEQVREVLKKLCDKLDQVEKDTQGIFGLAYCHGMNYTGANWSEEYKAARALLSLSASDVQLEEGGKEYGIAVAERKPASPAPTVQVPENLACEVKAQTVVSGVPSEAATEVDLVERAQRFVDSTENADGEIWVDVNSLAAEFERIRREAEAKGRLEGKLAGLESVAGYVPDGEYEARKATWERELAETREKAKG